MLKPDEFIKAWGDQSLLVGLHKSYDIYKTGLVTLPANKAEAMPLAEEDKEFLVLAGLPETLAMHSSLFGCLREGVPCVVDIKPDLVNNGIELPAIRYQLYYQIGTELYGPGSIVIEQFTGHIYRIDYGTSCITENGKKPRKPKTDDLNDIKWLQQRRLLGPFFISSSVRHLAELFLVFRNIFIEKGVIRGYARTRPSLFAVNLRAALEKVDRLAINAPNSVWDAYFRDINNGTF